MDAFFINKVHLSDGEERRKKNSPSHTSSPEPDVRIVVLVAALHRGGLRLPCDRLRLRALRRALQRPVLRKARLRIVLREIDDFSVRRQVRLPQRVVAVPLQSRGLRVYVVLLFLYL